MTAVRTSAVQGNRNTSTANSHKSLSRAHHRLQKEALSASVHARNPYENEPRSKRLEEPFPATTEKCRTSPERGHWLTMTGQVQRWRQLHDHEDIKFFDEVSAHCSRCGGDVVLCTKSEYDWHKWQRHVGRCVRGIVGKTRGGMAKGLKGPKGKAVEHVRRGQTPSSASEHLMQGDVAHPSAKPPLSILDAKIFKTRRHVGTKTTEEEHIMKHEESVDVSPTQYS
ncbi:hypothetical protein C8Q74DRAFT_578053 [Fomes fomentarius]|nr:hypothetical protein C8Q74DRAFT_578053 [Fomes fomentarius]